MNKLLMALAAAGLLLLLLGAALMSSAQQTAPDYLTTTAEAFDSYRETRQVEAHTSRQQNPILYRLHLSLEMVAYVDVRFTSIEAAERYFLTIGQGRVQFTNRNGRALWVNMDYVALVEPLQ